MALVVYVWVIDLLAEVRPVRPDGMGTGMGTGIGIGIGTGERLGCTLGFCRLLLGARRDS